MDYKEYENGVADVLAFVAGESAVVERNVRLPGFNSGVLRQIDIVVRGEFFGLAEGTVVVDCKCWNQYIDVADIGSFIDLVDDVRADIGLLMVSSGASKAAFTRACSARGIRVEVVTLDELRQWSPRGTLEDGFHVAQDRLDDAQAALRAVGFRTRVVESPNSRDGEIVVEAVRHYGTPRNSVERKIQHRDTASRVLNDAGIEARHATSSSTVSGGTPAHRWLEITVNGIPAGLRVLASTEADLGIELDGVSAAFGLPREHLDAVRPKGWPFPILFGRQASSAPGKWA